MDAIKKLDAELNSKAKASQKAKAVMQRHFTTQDYKHNHYGFCASCNSNVQFKSMDTGRKSYRWHQNFACFFLVDEKIIVRCFRAEQYFDINEYGFDPQFDLWEKSRYCIEQGKAQRILSDILVNSDH